jgi:hypothetical protein
MEVKVMKKLIVAVVLTVGLMAFGAGQATAQVGPVCVELGPFCDRLELSADANNVVWGLWDWTCDGVTLAHVIGNLDLPSFSAATQPVDAFGTPFGMSTLFNFSLAPSRVFDLWGTDGLSAPISFQLGVDWSYTNGPCVWEPGNNNSQNSMTYSLTQY